MLSYRKTLPTVQFGENKVCKPDHFVSLKQMRSEDIIVYLDAAAARAQPYLVHASIASYKRHIPGITPTSVLLIHAGVQTG
jgi:hypothetical protein